MQVRQNIRDKYGIEKKQPTKKSDKQTAAMMEELRKEYGMDDEDAKELQNKMDKVFQRFAFWMLLVGISPLDFMMSTLHLPFRMLLNETQQRRKWNKRWRY